MSVNDAAACLGARVRELRHERGLTLKALGRQAGLSHPFLSQLERGLARPSVASVERIAEALGVPVSSLWASRTAETATLIRADDGDVLSHEDRSAPGEVRVLATGSTHLRVREWSGGPRAWPSEATTTTGEVFVYVVRGSIEIDLDGTYHVLTAGDALRFDGSVRHRLRRHGPATTRALYVNTD